MEVMMRTGKYVAAYDISVDRERRRVDNVLKQYGFRIQKSVFECVLSLNDRALMIRELEHLNISSGFVKIYKREYTFPGRVIGCAPPDPDAGMIYLA